MRSNGRAFKSLTVALPLLAPLTNSERCLHAARHDKTRRICPAFEPCETVGANGKHLHIAGLQNLASFRTVKRCGQVGIESG
jgi:hypothetical protein